MTDISKHPFLRQICDVVAAIEACGASPQITRAATLAHNLLKPAEELVDISGPAFHGHETEATYAAHGIPFWLVWRSGRESGLVADSQREILEAAQREATRLAAASPGSTFVVLESVTSHRAVEMEVVDLRPERGLPY
jgi:CO/xanthine dehydrogenase FAD-binding subunit